MYFGHWEPTSITFFYSISFSLIKFPCLFQMSMDVESKETNKKVPKRLIHCSDGIVEEYSSEEDEEASSTLHELLSFCSCLLESQRK